MAKKEKKYLPPSGAGLVRYFEEETKGPKLSPEQVIIMTAILAVFCIALRFSYSWTPLLFLPFLFKELVLDTEILSDN